MGGITKYLSKLFKPTLSTADILVTFFNSKLLSLKVNPTAHTENLTSKNLSVLHFAQVDAPYSSSQSSSNTLSSNASSSTHSDDKWYEAGSRSAVRGDLELGAYLQGTSTDSGIDATSFTATQSSTASSTAAFRAVDGVPWTAVDETDGQRGGDSLLPAPDSLVIPAGRDGENPLKSPSGFPDDASYPLSDSASHSRCVFAVMCYFVLKCISDIMVPHFVLKILMLAVNRKISCRNTTVMYSWAYVLHMI